MTTPDPPDPVEFSALDFASALHQEFEATRGKANETNTAADWTNHVFPLLAKIAEDRGLWWAGRNTGTKRARRGENREYLWDFTMFHPHEDGLWNLPRVIVEHENAHDLGAFRLDHWKTLCGLARLRVAIGYVGARSAAKRQDWVDHINAAAEESANDWHFPDGTEDLIALGYYGMTATGNYQFWRRQGAARQWEEITVPGARS